VKNRNAGGNVAAKAEWQVYIVECADSSLYTGIARDLTSRIEQHNAGTGAKYTRSRLPVRLLYCEDQPDRSSASQREASIKSLKRAEKLELIAAHEY
jgi:predicted GIY-YIG superfamily endonuclease